MTNEQLWEAVLGELELSLSKANFTTWFKNTFVSSIEEEKIIIAVPNAFTKTWFENKYHIHILKSIRNQTNNKIKEAEYKIESSRKHLAREIKSESASIPEQASTTQAEVTPINQSSDTETNGSLNPRYIFNNFVVGKGNELARAAAEAVVNKLGLVYNPLFIYGGVGLGKTHLMQAIGNEVIKKYKNKKIVYTTSEKFTSEFIQAVSKGSPANFKDRYRNVDALLIDDIQFLAGKEGTQEEFFHTFNTLHHSNKQIIISSDRPPKAIPALENRLVSRFEWGMIVDISQPDFETRLAILEAKCKSRDCNLDREILHCIANTVQNNVRELEGALNRILAYNELNHSTPTLESTKNLLSNISTQPKKGAIVPKQVINTVAEFYDVKIENIIGSSRKKELVTPRQIIMYILREELACSYPLIGQELGGRDHTTAMHAHSKIAKELDNNEKINQDINLIKQRLYNT
ncbi:chromosomal replication initiator protein DnaA [Patescibacteria group bacterium]|nr:chromosomal replication initiator protein DnaA [Patescibacteria group bacterium]MBU1890958.1 chromosomal replication initiator protein DnaA [Patescibacteria group bacterium]